MGKINGHPQHKLAEGEGESWEHLDREETHWVSQASHHSPSQAAAPRLQQVSHPLRLWGWQQSFSPVFKHSNTCFPFWRSTGVTQKTLQKKKWRLTTSVHGKASLWANNKLRETMYSRVNQHMLTAFLRVTQSQWLHKDICCINLQYLKKALLSLRCIYTLIGFFLASK